MQYKLNDIVNVYEFNVGDTIVDFPETFIVIDKYEKIGDKGGRILTYDIKNSRTNVVYRELSKMKMFIRCRRKPKYEFVKGERVNGSNWRVIVKHYLLYSSPDVPEFLYDIQNIKTNTIIEQLTAKEVLSVIVGRSINEMNHERRIKYNKIWQERLKTEYLKKLDTSFN